MKREVKYIRRDDFHKSAEFKKINRRIDACLNLIAKLVHYNKVCEAEVSEAINVADYIIDFRLEQFKHFHETLSALYYSCYSIKEVYDISVMMNFNKIDTSIFVALETQRKYVTFCGIVQMASAFEFTRKEYENTIKGKNYYEQIKTQYPNLGDSLELLSNFRNTVHSNGKWGKDIPLEYSLREGRKKILKGEPILYDHWKLYRIIKDCIELSKKLALNNKANFMRDTRYKTANGEKVVVVQTNIDFKKLFDQNSLEK